jgi:tetratricopeptide (TPR) repeat protein
MRTLIATLCLATLTTVALAQSKDAAHYKDVYRLAIRYGDFGTAISATYHLMALDPADASLKDTLASLYFSGRSYAQAMVLGREILAAQPTNGKMLQLVAISEENLGRTKEALEAYEKVYEQTKAPFHLYKVAVLQYGLQRLGECQNTLGMVIFNPETDKAKVQMPVNQQQQQEVGLKAAAFYVRGLVSQDQKEFALARQAYQEAVRLEPNFVLAKARLDELNKPATKPAGK